MGILKSNSSIAAREINEGIAAELAEPRRVFEAMQLSPAAAKIAIEYAIAEGNWDLVSIIGLSQASNQSD